MDTVYGTKKYFQSLSGASDIYRSQACRAVSNDYTYQNTLGRRSTLGAYYHMNKQPSYTNEHSLNSQYSYNAWGIWRDGRNIAPSTFSAKTHTHYQKPRSFSIILTTAVFIVLLAVISIAGLAFYFSSIKANMEDPVLGFEGSFRIAKGDLYSTGLKYNHTTTYKQKIEFYKRFVERALSDNGLQPMRVDIWGFGEGPLIKVFFRTFLDVRKLPQNIHSVEEYIKESLFLETTAVKSLYRSLRIDPESVEIKRILDEQVVRSASLLKEAQSVPTSQTQLEKRLMKKPGSPPLLSKVPTTVRPRTTPRISHSVDDEPDVDVENAPVIQGSFEGSFEITKTDADISRKKVAPTKAYTSLPPKAVTPFALRVKPKKPSIEKLTTIIPQQQPSSTRSSSTSTSSTTTTTTSTTTTTTTTTEPPPPPPPPTTTTTTSSTTTTTTTPIPTSSTTTTARPTSTSGPATFALIPHSTPATPGFLNHFSVPAMTTPATTLAVPKLDSNLFTSLPVLDTAPWKPIHREVPELIPGPPPAIPTKTLAVGGKPPAALPPAPVYQQDVPQRRIDEIELPFIPEHPVPPTPPPAFNPYAPGFFGTALRKPDQSEGATNPEDMLFYHSFGNPVFMPGTDDIERLGAGAHVQPHPLPVPLIDDVVVPPFRPLIPTMGSNDKLHLQVDAASNEKFEHLGGGVIVKKHELSGETVLEPKVEKSTSTTTSTTTTARPSLLNLDIVKQVIASTQKPKSEPNINRVESSANSELADTIGEFFMGLLNLPKEEVRNATTPEPIQSRIEPEPEVSQEQQTVRWVEELDDAIETTTVKPNFMNLKDLILQRNQASNESKGVESKVILSTTTTRIAPTTTTPTIPPTTTTTTTRALPIMSTTTSSRVGSTTKRNRIRPTYNQNNKPPTILDDSSLFPSHSKWEFVNSSSTNNFGHTGNMRKVFNKTLQAWISEDVGNTEENFTLNDIKTRINNATNIQDISLIFDTLASKLGITPVVPTKVPPFSQNKMKHTQRNETRTRPHPTPNTTALPAFTATTTTTPTIAKTQPTAATTGRTSSSSSSTTAVPYTSPVIRRTTTTITTPPTMPTPAPTTTTTPTPTTKHFVELPLQRHDPFIKPMSSFMEDSSSEGIGAAIPVVGEAEVEVIDPTKYEEMLKSSQFAADTTTETAPQLVTLMPVRSNSGIRTYPHRAAPASAVAAAPTFPQGSAAAVYEEEMARSHGAATPVAASVVAGSVGGAVSGGLGAKVASITRKQNVSQGRRLPPAEAVVKGGIKVTVK